MNKPHFIKVCGVEKKLTFEKLELNPQVMEDQCSFKVDLSKYKLPVQV